MLQNLLLVVFFFTFNLLLLWLAFSFKPLRWYSWPGILLFIALPAAMVFFPQPRFEMDFYWWKMAGFVSMLMGMSLLTWIWFTLQKTQSSFFNIPGSLFNSGPFELVRHPIYLSFIFIMVGWWWLWAAVYAFYFGMLILLLLWLEAFIEEKFIMERRFGGDYARYKKQTGMFWIK